MYRIQKTLSHPVVLSGHGLHTGSPSRLVLEPANENSGIWFERSDTVPREKIPAHFSAVTCTRMATTLGGTRTDVRTVEHVLAAIYALGLTNVRIVVEGPEVPILDGSSHPFIEAILEQGIELQPFSARVLKVVKPIKIFRDGSICELLPRESLRLTTSVDFPHPSIGLQTYALDVSPAQFVEQISRARTFGFLRDVDRLKSQNLALGASTDNVLGFDEEGIINKEGARFPNECVRHKLLDAVGDLSLCGAFILGEMVSFRGGHSMHVDLLKALYEQPDRWELLPPAQFPTREGTSCAVWV